MRPGKSCIHCNIVVICTAKKRDDCIKLKHLAIERGISAHKMAQEMAAKMIGGIK